MAKKIKDLNEFNKSITLTLSKKEIKLLMSILKEAKETRSDMGCNDPYDNEEALFSQKERAKIQEKYLLDEYGEELLDEDEEDRGFMSNADYVTYLIKRVKEQV
jgi:23S rRNA A1618 N6-methylase RlmF